METKTNESKNSLNSVADMEELARLSKLCIGSSSIKEFSERAELSRAFLSAIINGKLRNVPTRKSLQKMVSPKAQPQNGIKYEQLLKAAGLEVEKDDVASRGEEKSNQGFLSAIEEYCSADTDVLEVAPYLLKHLLKRGMTINLHLCEENGCIVFKEEGSDVSESPKMYIGVTAFVQDSHLELMAVSVALLRIGEVKKIYKEATIQIYVLANREEIVQCLSKMFEKDDIVEVLYMAVSQSENDTSSIKE